MPYCGKFSEIFRNMFRHRVSLFVGKTTKTTKFTTWVGSWTHSVSWQQYPHLCTCQLLFLAVVNLPLSLLCCSLWKSCPTQSHRSPSVQQDTGEPGQNLSVHQCKIISRTSNGMGITCCITSE